MIPRPNRRVPVLVRVEKFFTRVAEPNACWIWHGARLTNGYGVIGDDRENGSKQLLVHRLLYEAEVGPIPAGYDIDHFYCDNPSCVRPSHVRPVARRENLLRSSNVVSLNLAKTHCKRGHEFTRSNTYVRAQGSRVCRTCHNERMRGTVSKRRARTRA